MFGARKTTCSLAASADLTKLEMKPTFLDRRVFLEARSTQGLRSAKQFIVLESERSKYDGYGKGWHTSPKVRP